MPNVPSQADFDSLSQTVAAQNESITDISVAGRLNSGSIESLAARVAALEAATPAPPVTPPVPPPVPPPTSTGFATVPTGVDNVMVTPGETIGAALLRARAIRHGVGVAIRIPPGDYPWGNAQWPTNLGGSPLGRLYLVADGVGARPRITGTIGSSWMASIGTPTNVPQYTEFHGLDFDGEGMGDPSFDLYGPVSNLRFDDCRFQRARVSLNLNPDQLGAHSSNVSLTRCIIDEMTMPTDGGAEPQGLYAAHPANLSLIETVVYRCGLVGGLPTTFQHGMYISGALGFFARGCLFADNSGAHLKLSGNSDGDFWDFAITDSIFIGARAGIALNHSNYPGSDPSVYTHRNGHIYRCLFERIGEVDMSVGVHAWNSDNVLVERCVGIDSPGVGLSGLVRRNLPMPSRNLDVMNCRTARWPGSIDSDIRSGNIESPNGSEFVDPTRTAETYHSVSSAVARPRGEWVDGRSPAAVGTWVRAGYELP